MSAARKSPDTRSRVVGLTVRRLRAQRGLTPTDLVRTLDELGWRLNDSQLCKMENGQRLVTVDEAVILAAALGVSVPFLLCLDDAVCAVCLGEPPLGYTCNECGARR